MEQRLGNLRFHAEEPEGLGGVVMVAHGVGEMRLGNHMFLPVLHTPFCNNHFEGALM